MLILSRLKSQKVIITCPNGQRLTTTVVDIRGDKVRLGFDAPDEYTIHRDEVQAAIDRENQGPHQSQPAEAPTNA